MLKRTLVLGASDNPSRYSFMAVHRLRMAGHEVVAIGKRKGKIRDVEIQTGTGTVPPIHTVTLYLNPLNQEKYREWILGLKPERVIFNPGTHNPSFARQLQQAGIETVEGCTLVMLSTGMF